MSSPTDTAIIKTVHGDVPVTVLYRKGHIVVHDTSLVGTHDEEKRYAVSHARLSMAYTPRFYTLAGATEFADYVFGTPALANAERDSHGMFAQSVIREATQVVERINIAYLRFIKQAQAPRPRRKRGGPSNG